jgi:hypothetical protein
MVFLPLLVWGTVQMGIPSTAAGVLGFKAGARFPNGSPTRLRR